MVQLLQAWFTQLFQSNDFIHLSILCICIRHQVWLVMLLKMPVLLLLGISFSIRVPLIPLTCQKHIKYPWRAIYLIFPRQQANCVKQIRLHNVFQPQLTSLLLSSSKNPLSNVLIHYSIHSQRKLKFWRFIKSNRRLFTSNQTLDQSLNGTEKGGYSLSLLPYFHKADPCNLRDWPLCVEWSSIGSSIAPKSSFWHILL